MRTAPLPRFLARFAVAAVVAAAFPGLARAQSPCGAFVDTCIDDFTCYAARTTRGTPTFVPVSGISLVDQFEAVTVSATRAKQICLPANKNAEGTLDAVTHLASYAIRKQSPRHIKRTTIRVTNQIGEIRVDTIRPDLLLVPTAKDLVNPPAPPNAASHRVDHYKCYRVRISPGTPKFSKGTQVTMSDQFTTPAKSLSLIKPSHLCNPVDKNGEGFETGDVHLLCYTAKPTVGQPKHVHREGLFVNNQFGPLRLDTLKETQFCIPSTKSFSPSGAFLDDGSTDALD